MTTTEILRYVTFATSLIGMGYLVAIAAARPDKWRYTVAPLMLCADLAIFLGSRLAHGPLSADLIILYNLWAIIIQLQVTMTIIGIAGVYLWTLKHS